jgi:hypothetical protein
VSPTANFETFEREAKLFQLMSDAAQVLAERRIHSGAHSPESQLRAPSMLGCGEQTADFMGKFGRRAEINGTLPATVAVAERVIRPEPAPANGAPGGDDRGLASEEIRTIGDKCFDTCEFGIDHVASC